MGEIGNGGRVEQSCQILEIQSEGNSFFFSEPIVILFSSIFFLRDLFDNTCLRPRLFHVPTWRDFFYFFEVSYGDTKLVKLVFFFRTERSTRLSKQ